MSKFRKLVLTVGALVALAVGGAAFAQAQNSSIATKPPVQSQSAGEATSPGDTDGGRAAEQGEHDQGGEAETKDGADGPHDQADAADRTAAGDEREQRGW